MTILSDAVYLIENTADVLFADNATLKNDPDKFAGAIIVQLDQSKSNGMLYIQLNLSQIFYCRIFRCMIATINCITQPPA